MFFRFRVFSFENWRKKSNDKQKLFPDNEWFRGDMIAWQMVAGFFQSLVDDDVIVIVVVAFLSFRPENVTGIDYFVYRMTLHFKWSALFSNLQNKIYFQAVVIFRDKFHMCNCSENNMKDDEKTRHSISELSLFTHINARIFIHAHNLAMQRNARFVFCSHKNTV